MTVLQICLETVGWLLMVGVVLVAVAAFVAFVLETVLDPSDGPRWRRERRV